MILDVPHFDYCLTMMKPNHGTRRLAEPGSEKASGEIADSTTSTGQGRATWWNQLVRAS